MAVTLSLKICFDEFPSDLVMNIKRLQEFFQNELDQIFLKLILPKGPVAEWENFLFFEREMKPEECRSFYNSLSELFERVYSESKQLGIKPKVWKSNKPLQIEKYIPLQEQGYVPIDLFECLSDEYVYEAYSQDLKSVRSKKFALAQLIESCKRYNPQNLPFRIIMVDDNDNEQLFLTPEDAYKAFMEAISK